MVERFWSWRASSVIKKTQLLDLAVEWLFEIIYFVNPTDAANFGATCKHARQLVCDQHLWSFYGTKLLAAIQSPSRKQEYVQEALLSLKFPSPKSLYLCLNRTRSSLIGWYMIEPTKEDDNSLGSHYQACGGLVCLRLNTPRGYSKAVVTLEVIDASGECISFMQIRYCESHQKLLCYLNETNEGLFTIEFDVRGDIELRSLCNSSGKSTGNSHNSNSYFLQPLPPGFQPCKKKDHDYSIYRSNVLENVGRIRGLFVAPYGSHGLELINISLIENEGRISEESMDTTDDKPYYVIDGLKVTGDPNVPAAQLSFTVDVTNSNEFHSWIISDRRPIIYFSNNGVVAATLMGEREANIKAAYRGKGQINRSPSVWDPEWVDLTLVVYNDPFVSNGATFSIVWDDVGEAYRHLMDFLPFSGSQYPPVQPPLTWSSTNFQEFII